MYREFLWLLLPFMWNDYKPYVLEDMSVLETASPSGGSLSVWVYLLI